MDGNQGNGVAESSSVPEGVERQELPSTATVMAVAAAAGVEPDALPPLYDTIDPDALDDLFRSPHAIRSDVRVSFTYAGCDVVVAGDGDVSVELQGGAGIANGRRPSR